MRSKLSLIALAVALLASLPVSAQGADNPGTAAVGLQGADTDGNEAKFREDALGEQSGLFLEELEYHAAKDSFNLDISARYTTGRSGWFDIEVTGDRWSGGLRSTLSTAWSATAFANDFLPSGTPVSELYPGVTELDPVFGVDSPRTERLSAEAWVTYRWSDLNRITLRAGLWNHDGERVPNYGGFSFSDVGTSSFYTAGLESFDSSASWFEVEGVFALGPVGLRVEAGSASSSIDRTNTLPAYGSDSLLDLNQWRDASDTDTTWLDLGAAWTGQRFGVYGALAWSDVSSEPAGGDRRVDASGEVVRDGLSIDGGSNDVEIFAGALGGSWRPSELVALTLSFDTRSSEGNGAVDLFLRGTPVTPTASVWDEERVGGTFQLKLGRGPWWVRLRARGTSTDLDRTEERDRYFEDVVRSTDRVDARLDASLDFGDGWTLSGWVRGIEDEVDVDLLDLWYGYATGNWESSSTAGSLSLAYRSGTIHAALNATASSMDIESGVPYFDPIFDPSVDLVPTTGDTSARRIWGSLLWPFDSGAVWVEAGWLQSEFDFDDTVELDGFAPVDETVSGTVTALGADVGAWEGGRISGRVEWTKAEDELDNDLFRGFLQADHTFASGFGLFARWAYWTFDNTLAPSADYAVNVIAAGARLTF